MSIELYDRTGVRVKVITVQNGGAAEVATDAGPIRIGLVVNAAGIRVAKAGGGHRSCPSLTNT
jgi:hypothetical protein